ncbi:SpoIID/LytB domain-containing protein [Candidatus Peregrinibacteria bacterium]|nr:SpoIID/LytB domain-containing protein [Candidatus Peregrinibacteria bacterium]
MKRFLNSFTRVCLFLALLGFAEQAVFAAGDGSSQQTFTGLIISWEKKTDGNAFIWLRVKEVKNNMWTKWYKISVDEDINEFDDEKLIKKSPDGWEKQDTLFSTNLSADFEYFVADNKETSGAPEVSGIRNISVEKISSTRQGKPSLVAGLNIPKKPLVISRQEWGADEDVTFINNPQSSSPKDDNFSGDAADKSEIEELDPEIARIKTADANGKQYSWPLQYARDIKFIVIHHTASVANLDDPKTAIQNIQYYHAVTRGWGDIGYNYVIDTNGRAYEGRKGGERVIGGHARPLNKVSIGIAVLGNYEDAEPSAAALRGLTGLIAAKSKLYNIDITGKTLYKDKIYNNVQGHFENSPTDCPGQFIKNKLADIRKLAAYVNSKEETAYPAKYDFSDFERREIIDLAPDTEGNFTIRLKNTGKVTWNKKTFLEDVNGTSTTGLPKILAKLQSPKVVPGNIGVFKGTIPPTLISGLRVPEAGLVINGDLRTKKSIPVPILVQELKATYELIGRSNPPTTMRRGKTATAWVMLKNTGNFTWKNSGQNRVSIGTSRPDDRKSSLFGGKTRIGRLVPKEVKPGETGKFIFKLTTPKSPGIYTEYFRPVVEGVGWMADTGMHFTVNIEGKEKPVRVALSFNEKNAQISSATGMSLLKGKRLVTTFDKGEIATVTLLKDGKYSIKKEDKKFILESPPRFIPRENGILTLVNFENSPAWNKELNDNLFRGILEIQKVDGKLKVINELQVEDYLKGIAEVSNGDPIEKIKTIIILARSYAKYYRDIGRKFPGKPYDLDDDPDHTQKYIGYGLEMRSPDIVNAVEQTTGKIVTYQGKPVLTPYFNQSDGRTRSAKEAWNRDDLPYLQSVPDTFCKTTKLKGHGVGLSGCGATKLAKLGKKAEEIIKYYYKGIEITD